MGEPPVAAKTPHAPPMRAARSWHHAQLGRIHRPRDDLDVHAVEEREPGSVADQTPMRSPSAKQSAGAALERRIETKGPVGSEREAATDW